MERITLEKFKALAQVHEPHCISIYIPTHRAGQEVNEGLDRKNLKNRVKEVRRVLESYRIQDRDIDALLKPIEELRDDERFWKHQSDGLAIFRTAGQFEYYTLPVFFGAFAYVSDHYYLKPLLPYLNDDSRFYLLSLSLHGARFYEGFAHRLEEILVDDLLPDQLKDTVGFDYEQKSLQFRMGQTGGDRTMYHGQGAGSEEEHKMEILKYLRAVNDGVMKILHDEKAPLVLAAVDYLVPLYREANTYKYLHDGFIAGNPEHEDPVLLHEKAKDLLEHHFDSTRRQKVAAFEQALSNEKASYKESEVVPAAVNQRVDTLFVRNRSEMWGLFDKKNNDIIVEDEKTEHNADLLNLAVMHTLLNGGRAYLMEPDEMPESSSKLNALFRF